MSELEFTENMQKIVLKQFGIRPADILETAASPDKTDIIDFEGADIRVHTKAGHGTPASTLLAIESVQGGKRAVNIAMRAYRTLSPNLEALSPLDVLRLLTESFGLLIRVGSQTGRLVLRESFRMDGSGNLLQPLERPRGSMISELYFKGDGKVMHCAMAFAIDTDLYSSWVKSQPGRVN